MYKDKAKQRDAVKAAVAKHRQGITSPPAGITFNVELANALLDPVKEAKLRSICYRLKEKGKAHDYVNDCDTTYLDMVNYGLDNPVKLSVINEMLNVPVK